MSNERISERDAERLLSGRAPEDPSLADLAAILQELNQTYVQAPSEERIAHFALAAAEVSSSNRPKSAGPDIAMRQSRSIRSLRRRLVAALAALVLLSGMTGLAAASDSSAPGDALYGVDRALETIGINDGEAAERISEAQALFQQGLVTEAITHAAEAATVTESENGAEAADALFRAAEQLRSNENGGDQAIDVRNRVAEMLDWMSEADHSGRDFGQSVADLAREISGEDDGDDAADRSKDEASDPVDQAADEADRAEDKAEENEGEGGPPAGVPGGPPEGVPGNPPEDIPGSPPEGTPVNP